MPELAHRAVGVDLDDAVLVALGGALVKEGTPAPQARTRLMTSCDTRAAENACERLPPGVTRARSDELRLGREEDENGDWDEHKVKPKEPQEAKADRNPLAHAHGNPGSFEVRSAPRQEGPQKPPAIQREAGEQIEEPQREIHLHQSGKEGSGNEEVSQAEESGEDEIHDRSGDGIGRVGV